MNQKSLVGLQNIDEHVEIYRGLWIRIDLHLQSWKIEIRAHLFEIELHFDEWQTARIAAELQMANQGAVGVGLVIVGIEDGALYLLKKFGDGLAVDETDTNRQEVYAMSDEAAVFQQGLAGSRDADDEIALCR